MINLGNRSILLLAATSVAMFAVLGISCRPAIQLPVPEPVAEVHEDYAKEQQMNPARLQDRVSSNELRAFYGTISGIEDDSLEFLVEEQSIGEALLNLEISSADAYVQCAFANKRDVLAFSKGDTATVYGFLDIAFDGGMLGAIVKNRAVKFKNCGIVPTQTITALPDIPLQGIANFWP